MNFYGHARVAAARRADGPFVLGAMLPDLAAIAGIRARGVHDRDLAAGVRLHHATDAAFHAVPDFVRLQRDGVRGLERAGLGRGPARGAAHVGVELMLDAAWAGDSRADAGYVAALGVARSSKWRDAVEWSHADAHERWSGLHDRLARRGLPVVPAEPEGIAQRIERALEARPRLRLAPGDRSAVAAWIAEGGDRVASLATAIMEQTEETLLARARREESR